MPRIRTGFALLALFILVPLLLLLSRTLQSLERERDQRHQSVASRVFDEAERSIGEFLEREETRPPEQYFPVLGDGRPSPLASPETEPFVIDHFQIDPAGRIASPRPERASLLGERLKGLTAGWQNQEESGAEEEVALQESLELLRSRPAKKELADLQRPGTTKAVQKLDLLQRSEAIDAEARRAPAADALEDEANEAYSSYQVLEQLNLARRGRVEKAASETFAGLSAEQAAAPRAAASAESSMQRDSRASGAALPTEVMASRAAPPERFDDADTLEREGLAQREGRDATALPAALKARIGRQAPARLPRMSSVSLDDQHLILYRTVDIAERGRFQQGMLLNLDRFVDWIEERIVVESGLSRYIDFDLVPARELGSVSSRAIGRFIYDHRFSEPFEALGARLTLTPLPDGGASTNIYLMGFLLVMASTLGLWAMYRRVAVAVHFAERRSNFAAAVSHELKTPLTAIRMYAEMLRDDMVPDAQKRKEYYSTITSEAERLTRLINNVLEFSNLEKRSRETEARLAPVEACLRDGVSILEPHAQSRGFTLRLDVAPGLPPVRFEPDALQQILFNLIDNALKYAEDAPRKQIDVSAQACEAGVSIRVRDYGAGVSPEHRKHLFEPFYRGESELTRRTKGTGIGLALVKGLAEQMGAELRAENAAGGGFEVEVRLAR